MRRWRYQERGCMSPAEYCGETDKVMYDKRGATTAANKRMADDRVRLRIYQCPYCDHWHLTKSL